MPEASDKSDESMPDLAIPSEGSPDLAYDYHLVDEEDYQATKNMDPEEQLRKILAPIRLYLRVYYQYTGPVYEGELDDLIVDVVSCEFDITIDQFLCMPIEYVSYLFVLASRFRRAGDAEQRLQVAKRMFSWQEHCEYMNEQEHGCPYPERCDRVFVLALIGLRDYFEVEYRHPERGRDSHIRSKTVPESATLRKNRRQRDQGKMDRCVGLYATALDRGETPPSPSELAKIVGCDKSTASRAIADLEAKRMELVIEDATQRYRRTD